MERNAAWALGELDGSDFEIIRECSAILRAALPDAGEVGRLRAAVKLASVWFEEYALLHRAKGTADGNDKGDRNQARADQLRAALFPTPKDSEDG